jgi:hypothetical protein
VGLVQPDVDLSTSLNDDKRKFWMLTPEGRAVSDGLDVRRSQVMIESAVGFMNAAPTP